MKWVSAGYRRQLLPCDRSFVVDRLSPDGDETGALLRLLADPEEVDRLLDRPELLEDVLESADTLLISPRFYFYLLTRHVMKASGIDEPELADYVSGVLEAFLHNRKGEDDASAFHVVDWIQLIERTPQEERFELHVRAGNQALFLTGIFPSYFERRRRRRAAPGIRYYEQFGMRSFDSAARHPLGRLTDEGPIFARIAGSFSGLRHALNDLSDRLVSIERSVAPEITAPGFIEDGIN